MSDGSDREWRLIREEAHGGPMNMALDEIAAATAADGGPRTVRVYRWEPSTVSLGYRQEPSSIDWAFCDRSGIDVTRRPTGGGGIYHDRVGDISYSIVAPSAEFPGDLMDSYAALCEPLFDAFERMGIDAGFASTERPAVHEPACYLRAVDPAHDVVVRGDGRKVSGNAQYRKRDAVIQHGSITYRRAVEPHLAVFTDHSIDPDRFRRRVTSIREQAAVDRATAVATVEAALEAWADAADGTWTADERRRARELAGRKYANDDWNRDRIDPTGSR